jgi:hypothetical protein
MMFGGINELKTHLNRAREVIRKVIEIPTSGLFDENLGIYHQ